MIKLLLVSALLLVVTDAQLIRQCTCKELMPCGNVNADTFLRCGNRCQRHVRALGIPYAEVRQCFVEIREPLDRTINCIKRESAQSCARGPPPMIPKRYMETFKLAFMTRIKNMLQSTGVLDDVLAMFKFTKKFTNCENKCVGKAIGNCKKQNNCGTLDPPDNELVSRYVNCAIESGLDTAGFRRLCHCAANAGMRNVRSMCDRIIVT
ncbi:hypothetical protein Q1695_004631 [Nippostrongylus brasiliensis]|nr:hypothetical protein Q1695_004631 [Nippostrongylus brasiliensis]